MRRFDDDENARLLLDTVPAVMRSIREEMRSVARGKFTIPQFRILNRLRKGPLTNSELSEWMGVAAPTMSRMIDPLEKKSLIIREYNPNDRRSQTLSLSPSGKREAEAIRRQALQCFAEKAKLLSSEDSHTLASGMKVLAQMFSVLKQDGLTERNKPSMKSRSFSLLSLAAIAFSLSSCMGDKSVDDYARERSRQEQAKLDAIQGTYRGALFSKETGQSMGALVLDLRSETDVQDSSDSLTKIQKPIAKGTLFYNGLNQSQVNFEKYYYDDRSRTLEIQIPIADVTGVARTLSLHASLQSSADGDTLSGEIEEQSLGGFTGTFTLLKNGPVSQSQNLSSGRSASIAAGKEKFVGVSPEEGANVSYAMTIQYQEKLSQQLFLNLFLPERNVATTLNLNGFSVLFKDAIINERAQTLIADSVVSSGNGSSHSITLNCSRLGQGTPAVKWDCRTDAEQKTHHIVFSLAPETQAQGS